MNTRNGKSDEHNGTSIIRALGTNAVCLFQHTSKQTGLEQRICESSSIIRNIRGLKRRSTDVNRFYDNKIVQGGTLIPIIQSGWK